MTCVSTTGSRFPALHVFVWKPKCKVHRRLSLLYPQRGLFFMGADLNLSGLVAKIHTDVEPACTCVPATCWHHSALLDTSIHCLEEHCILGFWHINNLMVFLSSLASGARRNEIHALHFCRLWFCFMWQEVTLKPEIWITNIHVDLRTQAQSIRASLFTVHFVHTITL